MNASHSPENTQVWPALQGRPHCLSKTIFGGNYEPAPYGAKNEKENLGEKRSPYALKGKFRLFLSSTVLFSIFDLQSYTLFMAKYRAKQLFAKKLQKRRKRKIFLSRHSKGNTTPSLVSPTISKKLQQYQDYIDDQLKLGVTNGNKLFSALQSQGYDGSYASLNRYLNIKTRGYRRYKQSTYFDFLEGLCQIEAQKRDNSRITRWIQQARFPAVKTLEDFKFKAQPSISEKEIYELASCRFLRPYGCG